MKKISLLNVISIIYILVIAFVLAFKLIFNLSLIGSYTNMILIILGLYIFISQIIKETQSSKVTGYIVFLLISFSLIIFSLFFLSKEETYFSSPNNTETLIIVEKSSLLDGYSLIYEKKFCLFKKPLNWNRIEGLNNFSSGYYTIKWTSEKTAIMNCNGEYYGQLNLD